MSSGMFRIGRWKCYLLMLAHQAAPLMWILISLCVALSVAGFIISPWIGLASLGFDAFILMSGISFVVFAYGFNSVTGLNMTPHSLEAEEDGLLVRFEEGEPVKIARDELRPYTVYPGGVVMPVGGSKAGWVWVPPKAFESDSDFKTFLSKIYSSEMELV